MKTSASAWAKTTNGASAWAKTTNGASVWTKTTRAVTETGCSAGTTVRFEAAQALLARRPRPRRTGQKPTEPLTEAAAQNTAASGRDLAHLYFRTRRSSTVWCKRPLLPVAQRVLRRGSVIRIYGYVRPRLMYEIRRGILSRNWCKRRRRLRVVEAVAQVLGAHVGGANRLQTEALFGIAKNTAEFVVDV